MSCAIGIDPTSDLEAFDTNIGGSVDSNVANDGRSSFNCFICNKRTVNALVCKRSVGACSQIKGVAIV